MKKKNDYFKLFYDNIFVFSVLYFKNLNKIKHKNDK